MSLAACGAGGEGLDVAQAGRVVDEAKKQAEVAQHQVEGGLRVAKTRVEEVGQDLGKAAGQVQTEVQTRAADAVPATRGAALDELVRDAPTAISCEEESCTIERSFADRLRAQPVAVASQAKVDPEQRDGRSIGLRLSEVGELPRLLGFQDRDVVTTVNGIQVRSLQSVPQLALQLRSATRFTIVYERGSTTSTKQITIE